MREDRKQALTALRAWQDCLLGRIDAAQLQQRTGARAQIGVAQGRMKLLAED